MTERASAFTTRTSVDICVCTYRRAQLETTLRSLIAQNAPELVLRVVVADNDAEPSAKPLVEQIAKEASFDIVYVHAPERNISIARNACLDSALGDWVAFIDDDETAPPNWIATLTAAALARSYDVVFGPALAVYPEGTPEWIRNGDYHTNRVPVHDGIVCTGHTCNALIRWKETSWTNERFLLQKGRTGGEDVEFFFRLWRAGLSLGVCDEAPVYETTAPNRLTYRWIWRRRFLAGQFHGAHSEPAEASKSDLIAHRTRLLLGSGVKAAYCALRAIAGVSTPATWRKWAIRSGFHAGVCAGALGLRQREQY